MSSMSFMIEEVQTKRCLSAYFDKKRGKFELVSTSCNEKDPNQSWLWTEYSQLMNMGRSKCVTEVTSTSNDVNYPTLMKCDSSDRKQKWKCIGDHFRQSETNNYLIATNSYARVITYAKNMLRKKEYDKNMWQRLEPGLEPKHSICSGKNSDRII